MRKNFLLPGQLTRHYRRARILRQNLSNAVKIRCNKSLCAGKRPAYWHRMQNISSRAAAHTLRTKTAIHSGHINFKSVYRVARLAAPYPTPTPTDSDTFSEADMLRSPPNLRTQRRFPRLCRHRPQRRRQIYVRRHRYPRPGNQCEGG